MRRRFMRNIFLEPDGGAAGGSGEGQATQQTTQQEPTTQQQAIDYEKLAQLVAGKQTATENRVLGGYFKQQGLSKEEMKQAISAFKEQKAANEPDVGAMQSQLIKAQAAMQQAQIQSAATMEAVSLGVDAKTIPYLIKMADLSNVIGEDGKINTETLKTTLNQVLEDVPALKPQAAGSTGFVQVGASGGAQQSRSATDDELDRIFGTKK